MVKADAKTGVKCFTIGGRMSDRLQRCAGMTDEERRWRAQWLKDQILSPEEPRYVHEYYTETNNIFRRLYQVPMKKLQTFLTPVLGPNGASFTRYIVGRVFIGMTAVYAFVYFAKYHTNDFTTYRTVELYQSRSIMYPDHPDYPNYPVAKKPSDYYDQGFYSSVLCQDVSIKDIPPPPPPPPPPPVVQEEPVICPAILKEE